MTDEPLQTKSRRRRIASWCMLLVLGTLAIAIWGAKYRNYKRDAFIKSFSPRVRGLVEESLEKGESQDQIKERVSHYVAEIPQPVHGDSYADGLKFNGDSQ